MVDAQAYPYMDAPVVASPELRKWSAPIYPASEWNPFVPRLDDLRTLLVLITLATLDRSRDKTDFVVRTVEPFLISDCKLMDAWL